MLTLWLTVVPLTFVLSLIVVYGNRWPQISFATLFMMIVTLEEHFTPMQALVNASWILLGGLWYTYWATLISHWQVYRIEQQALAESMFSCAEYLLARADFYDPEADLDECYRKLIEKQIAAVERQDAARDIVLRNLPKLKKGKLQPRRARLFNLFINVVDLHEFFVGAHTDYPLVRNTFGGSDLLIFYRDLMRKAATDLEEIGLAVLQNQPARSQISVKAELRAIEYELELMRKHALPDKNPEAYAAVAAVFRRLWSATRLIDRMRRHTRSDTDVTETEMQHRPRDLAFHFEPARAVHADLLEPDDGLAELPARAARDDRSRRGLLAWASSAAHQRLLDRDDDRHHPEAGLFAHQAAQHAADHRHGDRLRGERRAHFAREGAASAPDRHVRVDGDELQPAALQLHGERRVHVVVRAA